MAVPSTILEFLRELAIGAAANKTREYAEPKIRDAISEFNRPEQPLTPGATMIDGYPSMSSGYSAVTTPYAPTGIRGVEAQTLTDDQLMNVVNETRKDATHDFVRQYGSPIMSNAQKMLVKDVTPEVAQDPEMQKGAVALSSMQALAASGDKVQGTTMSDRQYADTINAMPEPQQSQFISQYGAPVVGPKDVVEGQAQKEPGFFDSAGSFFKNLFGDEERMTRLALAFNSMRYQPDAQLATVLGDRLKTLSEQRGHNATLLAWQNSKDPKTKKALDYYKATKDMKGAAKLAFGTDTTYGTTPRLVINPNTGEREWMVLGSDGTPKKVELPPGMEVPPNVEKVETATDIFFYDMGTGQLLGSRSKDIGKGVIEKGMAENWLDSVTGGQKTIETLTGGINAINDILDPSREDAFDRAFGMSGEFMGYEVPTIFPETQDIYAKLDQIGAQQFLKGFESLKGGGQISNVEGAQAKQAGLALYDSDGKVRKGLSESYVRTELKKLRDIYQRGIDRAKNGYRIKPGYNPAIHNEEDYIERIGGAQTSSNVVVPPSKYAGFSIAR